MNLTPYLDGLRRDLTAAAAPGGTEVSRAAQLLADALEASARLTLLEALTDAAAEITTRLTDTSVELRLRGRDADFVVSHLPPEEPPGAPGGSSAPATPADNGELARITLRLAESLKEQVDRAAAADGVSVNAWLVRAIAAAVAGGQQTPPGARSWPAGKRFTGFAQA